MATIKDVAREAGVAVGSVSRYLNGMRLKDENMSRIQAAIEKLEFKLNPMARGLKTSKSLTVGVVIPDYEVYTTLLVRTIEKRLYQSGYNVIVANSFGDPALEFKKVELLNQKFVDGIIIDPISEDLSFVEALKVRKIPFVMIDTGTRKIACDQVILDNDGAVYRAAEILIESRHRRIGFVTGGDSFYTANERLKGYLRALDNYAIPSEEPLIRRLGYTEEAGIRAVDELMASSSPPTAIIASNYWTTIGAIRAMRKLGLVVPRDLSFIGFDNIGLTGLIDPPLTMINQPVDEMGWQAADVLLRRIGGDFTDFPTICRLKANIGENSSVRIL